MTETEQSNEIRFDRKRRVSCLIRLLICWFSLMGIIIIGMIFIRSNVVREQAPIDAYVAKIFTMELPPGFNAYSMSTFFKTTTISYWDQNHLREDGRTTSLIAMYSEKRWADKTIEEIEALALPKLEHRLERNSFHTDKYDVVTFEQHGKTVKIHRHRGQTRMDEKLVAGTTCFRYVMTPDGPMQIQTMGFESDFPEETQLKFLKSLAPVLAPAN